MTFMVKSASMIKMIMFTQSRNVLHKHWNDEGQILCSL